MRNTQEKKKKSFAPKLLYIFIVIYIGYVLTQQHMCFKRLDKDKQYYMEQIAESQQENQELKEANENCQTEQFIEKIAREKLGMVKPNEKVYIDVSK